MAESLGLGVTAWSPFGGGLLSGKYRTSRTGRLSDGKKLVHTESSAQKTAIVDTVIEISDQLGSTPAQVATAWVIERSRRLATSGTPIIGPRSLAQPQDYLAALDLELTPAQYERLTAVSTIDLGIPHEANARSLPGLQGGFHGSFDGPLVPVA